MDFLGLKSCRGIFINLICIILAFSFFQKLNNAFVYFKIFIGVQLIYNVVLVSGVQQSDSVMHIHIPTPF